MIIVSVVLKKITICSKENFFAEIRLDPLNNDISPTCF